MNALSARLDVEVDRNGKTYGMSFRRGTPGSSTARARMRRSAETQGCIREVGSQEPVRNPDSFLAGSADLHQGHGVRSECAVGPRPSRLPSSFRTWPDRARCALRGRTIWRDLPVQRWHRGYVEYLADDDPVTRIIRLEGEGHFTEHVPVLDGKGHLSTGRRTHMHSVGRDAPGATDTTP